MPIEWVFFDMGGVLVDDQRAMLLIYRRLYERSLIQGSIKSMDEILSLREELIALRDGHHWVTAGKALLGDGWRAVYGELMEEFRDRYAELNLPFPGIGELLSWAFRNFNVGLAANQLTECRLLLKARGWENDFKVHGISEEIGFRKPQPEFFQWILDASGAQPENCVMIGDRIDNDIKPAKALGFRTIWFRMKPMYELLSTDSDAFASAYIESHKRASLYSITPRVESEQPDFVASAPREIITALESIAGK